MKAKNSRKRIIILACLVIILGVASFGLLGLLISFGGPEPLRPVTYPNEPGFQSAIIWFELAASKEEVFQILGDPKDPQGAHIRQVLDKTNTYDYCYMIVYSLMCLFILAVIFYLNQNKPGSSAAKTWILYSGVFLCIAMLAGDAMENVQMLKLTKYASVPDVDDAVVTALNIWTRVKWGAIFIFAAIMAWAYSAYFKGKKIPQVLFVMAYGSSAILGLISLSLLNVRFLVEPASYLIALAWLLSIIHAGIILKENIMVR